MKGPGLVVSLKDINSMPSLICKRTAILIPKTNMQNISLNRVSNFSCFLNWMLFIPVQNETLANAEWSGCGIHLATLPPFVRPLFNQTSGSEIWWFILFNIWWWESIQSDNSLMCETWLALVLSKSEYSYELINPTFYSFLFRIPMHYKLSLRKAIIVYFYFLSTIMKYRKLHPSKQFSIAKIK